MGASYGLAEGIVDAFQGYQGEVKRQEKEDTEKQFNDMKIETVRNNLNQQGFKESIQRLMMGDTDGATELWNSTGKQAGGERQMSDLNIDENGIVTWNEGGFVDSTGAQVDGKPGKMDIQTLASIAGVPLPAKTKKTQPWAAGPAKSGILYHKGTGETKVIPGGSGGKDKGYKKSGLKKKDYLKFKKDRAAIVRKETEKMFGTEFAQGKWALDGDAKGLYERIKTATIEVVAEIPVESDPDLTLGRIREKLTPLLKSEGDWRVQATQEADELTNAIGYWSKKDNGGLSYDKWIDKRKDKLISEATKEIKSFVDNQADFIKSLESGTVPENYGVPAGYEAPQGVGIPGQTPQVVKQAAQSPAAQPPAGIPQQQPAATSVQQPQPAQANVQIPRNSSESRDLYAKMGGNSDGYGQRVGYLPGGQPMIEGKVYSNRSTGKSIMIINGKATPIN